MAWAEWRDFAKCKGANSDIFFRDDMYEEALTYCESCPVKKFCLDDAVWTRSDGTWGGTTKRQRLRRTYSDHTYMDHSEQIALIEILRS